MTRKNKKKIALVKLVALVGFMVWANGAIDRMKSMTPEEFWGQFESHTIIIENVQAAENKQDAPKPETKVVQWEAGEFSAYTASEDETDDTPNIAANGREVYLGGIACPNRFKLGQKIEIRALGVYTCNDRMAARYRESNHFDIFHSSKAEAFQFGRQKLEFRAL